LLSEAFEVLRAYGIPVADYQVVRERKGLKEAMGKMEKPVALKVISPEVSHKSDKGGVLLNIHDLSRQAFEERSKRQVEKRSQVFLSRNGLQRDQVILGASKSPLWSVVLFSWRDLCGDPEREFHPFGPDQSIRSGRDDFRLKASAILKGPAESLDIRALVENLLRLSQLMVDFPQIEGIDINPVIVLEGAVAVDARISLLSREISITK
jgi:acyl-CoA synthetase (NDP forming)